MADSPKRSRAKAATPRDGETEPQDDQTADDGEQGGEQVQHVSAPDASDPSPAGPVGAGDATSDADELFDTNVLVAHSDRLLGYDPAVVRGVLADAPDQISVADARHRIEKFLTEPVALSTTDEEA